MTDTTETAQTQTETADDDRRRTRVERYEPTAIEPRWQARWDELGLYETDLKDTSRPKYYLLTMYRLPVGRPAHRPLVHQDARRDALARFRRMQGYNVFFPIGFDAFGLPAENAAIKSGGHPFTWTMSNIENMRRQLRSMGAIVRLDARGRHGRPVVLPLEPVDVPALPGEGPGLPQDVAGRLVPQRRDAGARAGRGRRPPLLALRRARREARPGAVVPAHDRRTPTSCSTSAGIDWPEPIRIQQTNWIGRSEGAEIDFETAPVRPPSRAARRSACSRRGRTRCSGPRSWSSPRSTRSSPSLTAPDKRAEVDAYVEQARRRTEIDRLSTDREKTGVAIGADAINPINGERIPIFIADYVLSGYGTGAIMAVPAHDERDFAFATAVRPADPARRRGARHRGRRPDERRLRRARRRRAPGQQRRVRRACRPTRAARPSSPKLASARARPSPRSPTDCATG